ncbi:heavy-metal-associated domain-containing protein [Pelagibacterium sp.]|uniref:heavy-metal-associated domain-containing protein n=1 Tax=Pelagibacterium sp. TaxID=1967288 RepID=UPI003A924670
MEFHIDNMTCGGCAKSVTKAIQSVDPEAKVDIDLGAKVVRVISSSEEAAIAGKLDAVGYSPRRAA